MSCTKDHKEGVDPKKKGPLGKLKERLDKELRQVLTLLTFIRLGVMVWAGFIISLNYITFPGLAKDGGPKDITFIASVFTGCLATFSVDVGKKKKDGKDKEKLPSAIPTQTIRIEQAPIKIVTSDK